MYSGTRELETGKYLCTILIGCPIVVIHDLRSGVKVHVAEYLLSHITENTTPYTTILSVPVAVGYFCAADFP